MSKFNEFKDSAKLDVTYVQSRGYGWRLGSSARAELLKHLDDEWPDAPADVKANFYKMFEVGSDLLGVPVLGVVGGSLAGNVYLVRVTEEEHQVAVNDVDFKRSAQLGSPGFITCPVSGEVFNWTCLVKLNSVKVVGSETYTDTFSSNYRGTLAGKRYTDGKVESNDISGVATYGTIDYKSGLLELSRSSNKNIKLLDDLIEYVKTMAATSASGTSTGGASAPAAPPPDTTKHYESFLATCTMYVAPAKLLWTYTMPTDGD